MDNKRRIQVSGETLAALTQVFKCTKRMVWMALSWDRDTPLAKRIRRAAIEKGGRVMNWLPECETIHCADGTMRQTFPNGAEITVDWEQHRVEVRFNGEVARFEGTAVVTLDDFHALQAWTEALTR